MDLFATAVLPSTVGTDCKSAPSGEEYVKAAQNNDLDSMIAADAGHETFHSTDKKNLKDRYENLKQNKKNDVEAEPERVETQIIKQLNEK